MIQREVDTFEDVGEAHEPPPLLAAQGSTLLEAAFIHGLPCGLSGRESTCHCRRRGFDPWVEENIWRRAWLPTPVLENPMDRGAWGLQSMGSPWVSRDWATKRRYQEALYTGPCPLAARDETKLVSGISPLRIWVWDGVSQRLAVWLGLFTGELGGHRLTTLTGGLGNRGAEGWHSWKDRAAARRQTGWPGIEWGPVTATDAPVLVQPTRPGGMSATAWWSVFARSMVVAQSFPTFCDPVVCPWDFPGKNTGVGCHPLLQGIFPTQGSNLSLLHCRWILCHWTTCHAMLSCSVVSDSLQSYGLQPTGFLCPWDSPGKNAGVGSHALLPELHDLP